MARAEQALLFGEAIIVIGQIMIGFAMRCSFSAFSRSLFVYLSVSVLAACGSLTVEADYPQNDNMATAESGSIFDFFRSNDDAAAKPSAAASKATPVGLGVNALLWRASLDTLAFMPLASADPMGGVIITDWHSDPTTPNERVKLNLVISGRDLRADALRVSVFRETNRRGQWVTSAASSRAARQMENIILTRARDLAAAQRASR